MAYHLTGAQAHRLQKDWKTKGPMKPLAEDQGIQKVTVGIVEFEDSLGRFVRLRPGTKYNITGTRDGNGYVMTWDRVDTYNGTRYLTAEQGCKLV